MLNVFGSEGLQFLRNVLSICLGLTVPVSLFLQEFHNHQETGWERRYTTGIHFYTHLVLTSHAEKLSAAHHLGSSNLNLKKFCLPNLKNWIIFNFHFKDCLKYLRFSVSRPRNFKVIFSFLNFDNFFTFTKDFRDQQFFFPFPKSKRHLCQIWWKN